MNEFELFDFFKDTALMLANNEADIQGKSVERNWSRADIIKDYLEEIEGDAYTFLHTSNLNKLVDNSLISIDVFDLAVKLRELVQALPKELWTVQAYDESAEWKAIQLSAQTIIGVCNR